MIDRSKTIPLIRKLKMTIKTYKSIDSSVIRVRNRAYFWSVPYDLILTYIFTSCYAYAHFSRQKHRRKNCAYSSIIWSLEVIICEVYFWLNSSHTHQWSSYYNNSYLMFAFFAIFWTYSYIHSLIFYLD